MNNKSRQETVKEILQSKKHEISPCYTHRWDMINFEVTKDGHSSLVPVTYIDSAVLEAPVFRA